MRPDETILSKLIVNPDINPRSSDTGIADLKAQIVASGFTDPITVREVNGLYEVIDGSRRLAAITELSGEGKWLAHWPIPVFIVEAEDGKARELALAANVVRAGLSPADEAVGFYRLKLSGETEDEIAARFAVPLRRVRQRLALGSLPDKILDALRKGRIGVEAAEAFTLSPSPARQVEVFDTLSDDPGRGLPAHYVRQAMINQAVRGTDPRARFVGAEAYEEAGGVVTRDLFSDAAWFGDGALLQSLFDAKLEATVQSLKDAGWSWVEITTHYNGWHGEELKPRGKRVLTDVEGQRIAAIRARLDQIDRRSTELQAIADATDAHDEEEEALAAESGDIEAELEALEERPFTAPQMKKAGVLIIVGHRDVEIRKGLVKPVKGAAPAKDDADADGDTDAPGDHPATEESWPEALHGLMAVAARDAVKLALAQVKPALAARMGLAARICEAHGFGTHGPFTVARTVWPVHDAQLHAYASRLMEQFHGCGFAETLAILESKTPEQIVQLEALMTALAFRCNSLANSEVREVIEMVDPDMAAEGFAVGADFLKRLNRASLDAIVAECGYHALRTAAKKPDAVNLARVAVENTGWLPIPLRTPSYSGPGSNAWSDAKAPASGHSGSSRCGRSSMC